MRDETAVTGAVGFVKVPFDGMTGTPVGRIVNVLLPTFVTMVVVRFVTVAPEGVMVVMLAGAVGPFGVVTFIGVEGPPVGRIGKVLLLKPTVTMVEMFVYIPPVEVTVDTFGSMLPVGITDVMFAGAVGPIGAVKFPGGEGPPVGRIVNVLLPTTVVIVVEMSVKVPTVGVMDVEFNVVIDAGMTVGPEGYELL